MLFNETIYSQIGNFENTFTHKFSRRIILPKMENYPLQYFSNSRADFLKAQSECPKLKNIFIKMNKLRNILDSMLPKKRIVTWSQSALERNSKTKTVCVQIIFESKKTNASAAENFIDNLGIF